MEKTKLGDYKLIREWSTNKAGMCKWNIGEKDGNFFFIKEFLSPKYPDYSAKINESLVNIMRKEGEAFFDNRYEFYKRLSRADNGNNVIAIELFRAGNSYFLAIPFLDSKELSIQEIWRLPNHQKDIIIKSLIYNVYCVHRQGIVHSDLKPNNILVIKTSNDCYTAKLIDFESGFIEGEIPEEIEGDQVYYSPEALMRNCGEDTDVTCKSDIFSLGIIIHQYLTGDYPIFDKNNYNYICEYVADGNIAGISSLISQKYRDLISAMLVLDSEKRISASEALKLLGIHKTISGSIKSDIIFNGESKDEIIESKGNLPDYDSYFVSMEDDDL